ncbi:MAG: dienelactone hydrolase family protein [Acidobacteriota bacterium]
MKNTIILFLILFTLICCSVREIEQVIDDSRKYLKVGDIDMYYGITIPDSYRKGEPVPLVLALHYGGTFSDYYGKSFARQLVEPGLEQLGAIIISPTCPSVNWTTETSEKAIIGLLDHIRLEYLIDSRKILVTGFSLGGEGTWHFAAKFPEIFSIAIPIAGPVWRFTPEFLNNIQAPVYVIHSRDDETIQFSEVEKMVNLLIYSGMYIEFRILEDIHHFEVNNYTEFLQESVPWIFSIWDSEQIN